MLLKISNATHGLSDPIVSDPNEYRFGHIYFVFTQIIENNRLFVHTLNLKLKLGKRNPTSKESR